jgi:hypothetical protein
MLGECHCVTVRGDDGKPLHLWVCAMHFSNVMNGAGS